MVCGKPHGGWLRNWRANHYWRKIRPDPRFPTAPGDFNLWPAAACAECNYGPHALITKKRHKWTERQRHRHIIFIEPNWGPLESSVEINASRHWTPTLKINTNKKTAKGPRTTGRMNGHIILPLRGFDPLAWGRMHCAQLQAARFDFQKATRTTGQRHRHIISTGPHWDPPDPSLGDKMHICNIKPIMH